ncbi:MAG: hypothetical protein V4638_00185 [Bacteroidota bacterium]
MKRIALIEFGGSHAECLLSQFFALKKANYHITFIGTKQLWEQNKSLHSYADAVHFIEFEGKAIGDFKKALALNRYLKEHNIEIAIFNTAQGGHVRNMCLFAPKSVEFIGIIHTLKKFKGSFTQQLITRKIKKYLVLNDYFKEALKDEKGVQIESFYPLRFPHFKKTVVKNEGEIWVTIIGGVENRRKDLIGSIALMKQLPSNFRFIFLGKSNAKNEEIAAFLSILESENLNEKVKIFNNFVPEEIFDAYLKNTDFIWPMVHPNTPSAGEYFRNQIPGAINVAFSYKIPMWIHSEYVELWGDLRNSVHYSLENFPLNFDSLAKQQQEVKAIMLEQEKFKSEFQEEKFRQFLSLMK